MTSRVLDALRRLPALARPRLRVRKASAPRPAHRREPQPRPARVPYVLKMSMRCVSRRTLDDARVPYLRMSGRWLEVHGFAIGSAVRVRVEHGRVTLISE